MWKNRILYLLVVLVSWLTYFFGNEAGTLTAAVVLSTFPIILFLFSAVSVRAISVEIRAEQIKEKTVIFSYQVHRAGRFCFGFIKWITRIENLYTGECIYDRIRMGTGTRQDCVFQRKFVSDHCGAMKIAAERVIFTDLLGLWQWSVQTRDDSAVTTVKVFPDLFTLDIILQEDVTAMIDSDEYSGRFSGDDPGETFAIRDYVPGDSLKRIHWKLSQKTDHLLVREFGRPVVNRILIIFENVLSDTGEKIAPEQADALAKALYAVGNALIREQCVFTLCFGIAGTDGIAEYELRDGQSFHGALEQLLEQPYTFCSRSVAATYMAGRENCAFAHVAVFAPKTFPDYNLLYNGNHVSVLTPAQGNEESKYTGDGLYQIFFSVESLRERPAQLIL